MNTAKMAIDTFFSGYSAQTYKKGEVIIRPDETPGHVFYLTEGLVSQYDISPAGNEIIVNTFKPGAFFPMSLAINQGENPYFFEVTKPAVMQKAPAGKVVELLKADPDITFDLLSRVYRGTDGLLRRMAHLMGGKAKSRLLFELSNAARRFGAPTRDGHILIPLTEGDLAKRSGLSRETVSRLMRDLKQNNLASTRARSIVIYDISQLEDLLGSEL